MGNLEAIRNTVYNMDLNEKSSALGISPDIFQQYLQGAKTVYEKIVGFGPFYGANIRG